jgi:hypothetical protein
LGFAIKNKLVPETVSTVQVLFKLYDFYNFIIDFLSIDKVMYPRYKRNSKTGYIFQCENCKKSYSLTKDTWFDNSKLNFVQHFKLIYCWANDFTVTQTVKETLINEKHVINKFQKLREVCAIVVSNNSEEIGGVGEIVEIDETKLYKA